MAMPPEPEYTCDMSTVIRLSTAKTVDEVTVAVQAVVSANHLGVTKVYNFQELTKKGVEFAKKCVIVEVGKLRQANVEPGGATDIPSAQRYRISIYVKGGRTMLATLKPTSLQAIFSTPQMALVARHVEAMIVNIMRAAARDDGDYCLPA